MDDKLLDDAIGRFSAKIDGDIGVKIREELGKRPEAKAHLSKLIKDEKRISKEIGKCMYELGQGKFKNTASVSDPAHIKDRTEAVEYILGTSMKEKKTRKHLYALWQRHQNLVEDLVRRRQVTIETLRTVIERDVEDVVERERLVEKAISEQGYDVKYYGELRDLENEIRLKLSELKIPFFCTEPEFESGKPEEDRRFITRIMGDLMSSIKY